MRTIYLFCAGGMSTSMLVKKMKEHADSIHYEAKIAAFGVAEIEAKGHDADVVLLGPQVRFQSNRIKGLLPGKPVEVIDMKDYGTMNGKAVIDKVKQILGD